MRKKRAFTLLEVILSLSLTAILMTVLMGSAAHLFFARARVESAKQEILAKMFVQERLSTIFLSLDSPAPTENGLFPQGTPASLHSEDGLSLTLWLERQIDSDPAFCGKRKGMLCVEKERLVFKLFGKNGEVREEVLLKGVKRASFQFFDPFEEPPHLVDSWKEKTGETPSFLILTIEDFSANRKNEFAFFFPSSDNFVVYHPLLKTGDEQ